MYAFLVVFKPAITKIIQISLEINSLKKINLIAVFSGIKDDVCNNNSLIQTTLEINQFVSSVHRSKEEKMLTLLLRRWITTGCSTISSKQNITIAI